MCKKAWLVKSARATPRTHLFCTKFHPFPPPGTQFFIAQSYTTMFVHDCFQMHLHTMTPSSSTLCGNISALNHTYICPCARVCSMHIDARVTPTAQTCACKALLSPLLRLLLTLLACLRVLPIAVKPSGSSSRNHDCTEAVQVACACRDIGGFGDGCNNGTMVGSVVLGIVN